ncbi:WD40-repeat-containing domain protein [Rhodocollybia butyracea]|uniref:WD40-repeat-containing domain protein n=1 Tax=Rhodocollybia butyracea TaxID=206335 RepID=A0A9P5P8J7_9AGAR|nr:WD40-repeat-containing domain protein [Rhodocollybia butyracea]
MPGKMSSSCSVCHQLDFFPPMPLLEFKSTSTSLLAMPDTFETPPTDSHNFRRIGCMTSASPFASSANSEPCRTPLKRFPPIPVTSASSLFAVPDTVETPVALPPITSGDSQSVAQGPSYIGHLTQDLSFPNLKEKVIAPCALATGYDIAVTSCIWNSETGEKHCVLEEHTGVVRSVAFSSPDGTYIASSSDDKTIRIWDSETGGEKKVLRGHTDWVQSVAYSPDGKKVVSGSSDQTIRIWNLETGEELHVLQGHTGPVMSVAFSPDGSRIVSGSYDGTVRIWDAGTGKEVGAPLEGHTDSVLSVVYSPTGKHIASGSWDRTVRLWSAEMCELVCVLEGHTSYVWSVAFTPDGKQIASGSWDGTLRLWDVEMGRVR